jgi:hypothetical protein
MYQKYGYVSSFNIVSYILSTFGPLSTFLGTKNYFLVVLDYFSYKNGSNDLVRGLFSSLDIGTYIPLSCGPLCTILGPFGAAQLPQNSYLVIITKI